MGVQPSSYGMVCVALWSLRI